MKALVIALNDYGKTQPEFEKRLALSIGTCLERDMQGVAYHMIQIIRQQLILESRGEASIHFLDEKMIYDKLGTAICKNKEYFTNLKIYEGSLYEDGMYGALKYWCNDIFARTGKRIL